VLKSNGQIAFPKDSRAFQRQKQLLEDENVMVKNGKVSLSKYG
jgi:methylated-DNA-protein-cysteine methyltransferase-like protein